MGAEHFGAQALLVAIRAHEPRLYCPPQARPNAPTRPSTRDDERINRSIRLVRSIRERRSPRQEPGAPVSPRGVPQGSFAGEYWTRLLHARPPSRGSGATVDEIIGLAECVRNPFYNPDSTSVDCPGGPDKK